MIPWIWSTLWTFIRWMITFILMDIFELMPFSGMKQLKRSAKGKVLVSIIWSLISSFLHYPKISTDIWKNGFFIITIIKMKFRTTSQCVMAQSHYRIVRKLIKINIRLYIYIYIYIYTQKVKNISRINGSLYNT